MNNFCIFAYNKFNKHTHNTLNTMKKRVLTLAAFFALSLCGCSNDSPEKAVEGFYKASQEHDMMKALSYTNVDETEREQIAEIVNAMEIDIIDYEILNTAIDEGDTTATVEINLSVTSSQASDTIESTPKSPASKPNPAGESSLSNSTL